MSRHGDRQYVVRRKYLQPADVGLSIDVGLRRVAGLRREEVAVLAGISTECYLRLEQGRDRSLSVQVPDDPANKTRTVVLTAQQFRYSFGNALTQDESDALFEAWTIPGPGRSLFEDATANFRRSSPTAIDTHQAARGPLLLTSGTECHGFDGRGHSLTIDAGWRSVADVVLDWLAAKNLDAPGWRPASCDVQGGWSAG
ncbi:hypothetical protein ACQFYA_12095 [Promicromonospora sp. Marseille-Q5078]